MARAKDELLACELAAGLSGLRMLEVPERSAYSE
jgi:hypothetical protein